MQDATLSDTRFIARVVKSSLLSSSLAVSSPVRQELAELSALCARAIDPGDGGSDDEDMSALYEEMRAHRASMQDAGLNDTRVISSEEPSGSPVSPRFEQLCSALQIQIPGTGVSLCLSLSLCLSVCLSVCLSLSLSRALALSL